MDRHYDRAFRWYMDKISGHLTPEDEVVLLRLLAEDTDFRRVWEDVEKEGAGLAVFMEGLDAQAGLDELKAGMAVPVSGAGLWMRRRVVAAAAAVILLAAGGWYFFGRTHKIRDKEQIASIVAQHQQAVALKLADGKTVILGRDSAQQTIVEDNAVLTARSGTLEYKSQDTAQNTLSIPAGQNYHLVLSDGTEVTLNAATNLRFPFAFNGRSRDVYVEGEAYFKVARDAARPFVVHTPLTQIQVLGTEFNVNTYNAGTVTTSLVEGKVLTHAKDGKDVELRPGYAADFHADKGFALGRFDSEDVLSWMNGTYYFHNTPVDKLTDVIFRCYGLNIVIDKEKFANRSVTGLMDRRKLIEFLDDLETTAHIKYYYSGNQLRLE